MMFTLNLEIKLMTLLNEELYMLKLSTLTYAELMEEHQMLAIYLSAALDSRNETLAISYQERIDCLRKYRKMLNMMEPNNG